MKKITIIFLLAAQSLVAQNNNFLIEGNIYDISKSDTVGYSLYEDIKGEWNFLFTKNLNPLTSNLIFNSYREHDLNLNTTYLLVFHKNSEYKYLYVETSNIPGNYKINVFFDETTQAFIYYDYKVKKYIDIVINKDTVESLLNKRE